MGLDRVHLTRMRSYLHSVDALGSRGGGPDKLLSPADAVSDHEVAEARDKHAALPANSKLPSSLTGPPLSFL